MQFVNEEIHQPTDITILQLIGELDASSYQEVIAEVHRLYLNGMRNLLLDLSQMPFMASSGLVALHSIAVIMDGGMPPDPESGWNAMHAISSDIESNSGHNEHCRLLSPLPRVAKTLEMTGFDMILATYTDKQEALDAFAT
jgi:anti-anti-sigma regulatory factor